MYSYSMYVYNIIHCSFIGVQLQLPQDVGSLPHPYQFFERPPTRGEPSSGAPIQFPKVPEAAEVQPPEPTAKLKPASIKHPLNVASNHLNVSISYVIAGCKCKFIFCRIF